MALITCPDCNKEISDKAISCIHCGCPITPHEPPPYNPYDEQEGDKIRDINGATVNIDALIRVHERDNLSMIKELQAMTNIPTAEAKRITDIAFRNRGIKPLGILERARMEAEINSGEGFKTFREIKEEYHNAKIRRMDKFKNRN